MFNRMRYRSGYIQKGYGLGGIFRGIVRLFRPVARNVVKVLSKPEVRKVLKTVGKETVDTGKGLLMDKLQGKDLKSMIDKRINIAKRRIADSIEEGIKSRKQANNIKRYHHIRDKISDDETNDSTPSNTRNTHHTPKRIQKHTYSQLLNKTASSKSTPRGGKTRKRKTYRTVFD